MVLFLARRTVYLAVLVAAVAMLSFSLSAWAPGSFDAALRLESHYPGSAATALRARHGLDRPVLDRIGRWVGSVARGDLGVSIEYDAPVAPLVLARASRTLLLGFASTSLAWIVAIPLGAWMAAREGSWGGRACRAGLALALSLPEPAVALGLMLLAVRAGAAPAGGMLSARLDSSAASSLQTLADLVRHLALPAVALAVGLTPVLAGHVRSSLADTLHAPFIVAATSRGVPGRRVLFRSALRAAAAPLMALFGLSVASLFSASLLVEVITGWPGLGPLLVEATRSRDVPVVIGVTLCSVLLLAAGNLVTDIGMRLADPRARARTGPVTER